MGHTTGGSSGDLTTVRHALFLWLGRIAVNGIAVVPLRSGSSAAGSRIALALYPLAANLNHSCAPSVSFRFEDGHHLVARCWRDVAQGETLVVSYGPQLGESPTAVRRGMLQEQYRFTCTCEACSLVLGDDPADVAQQAVWRDMAHSGLHCSHGGCDGAVLPEDSALAGLAALYPMMGNNMCGRCGMRLDAAALDTIRHRLTSAQAACDEADGLLRSAEAAVERFTPANSHSPAMQLPGRYGPRASTTGGGSAGGGAGGGALSPRQAMRDAGVAASSLASAVGEALAAMRLYERALTAMRGVLHRLNMMVGMASHGAGRAALVAARAAARAQALQPPAVAGPTSSIASQGPLFQAPAPPTASRFDPTSEMREAMIRGAGHYEASLSILDAHYPAHAPAPAFERLELCELLSRLRRAQAVDPTVL